MTNDIQLANSRGYGYAGGGIEPWGQPAGGALGAAQPQPPLRKIHQVLRGRYLLAIVLALLCGAGGGVAGYLSQKPGYKSVGVMEIKPIVPDWDAVEKAMLMYTQQVQSVVARLKSERLIRFALDDKNWKDKTKHLPRPASPTVELQDFSQNLKVEHLKGTSLIQVTYIHPDPNVAQAAVKAVLTAYKQHYSKAEDPLGQGLKMILEKEYQTSKAKIAEAEDEIRRLASTYGEDLQPILTTQWQTVAMYTNMAKEVERELSEAVAMKDRPDAWPVEEIALISPEMQGLLATKSELETRLRVSENQYGQNNPGLPVLRQQLDAVAERIDRFATIWRQRYVGYVTTAKGEFKLLPSNLDELRRRAADIRKSVEVEEARGKELAKIQGQIKALHNQIAFQRNAFADADRRLKEVRFRTEMVSAPEIISEGDTGSIALDSRVKFGLLGLIAGGSLPIALLLVVGLFDHRYRYSDEATAGPDGMSGINLLGILPNLPDRLSDPEQAAIAAHCVHQIRTMLQINGGLGVGAEDRRVFAVTSAAPGDGKTSLTLALGLSYAACGTRTLLIDCDLVGAGLSTRMNVAAPEGILEAVSTRSLLPYVRTTDIADVAILPVGFESGHHASTLSPNALRRLIDEAKQHFDTILIDTGPILGSIEASLVCAAADGVVLTVSRRQLRPLVERSINHLHNIGARLAGIVFNRAESNDFERSISGVSLRSAAAANGHSTGSARGSARGEAVGPVARAVAAQVKD